MRKVWLAAVLAFFLYPLGAGYLYVNKKRKAVLWVLFIWLFYFIFNDKPYWSILNFIAVLGSTWDCSRMVMLEHKAAKEVMKKQEEAKRVESDAKQKALEQKRQAAKAKFETTQKAKGLVEYNGKWGTPEQVEKRKEIEVGLDKNFSHLSHFEFEAFIGKLFKRMGYETTVTRKTGDFGIDVIAKNSKNTIAIQVKQNSPGNHVGAVTVQNVLGSMWRYKANKAIIITTSDFTVQAEQQAREAPVELWNKAVLHRMVRKYFIDTTKVSMEKVQVPNIRVQKA